MTKKIRLAALWLAALTGIFVMGCTQERQPCLIPTIASLNMVFMHLPTDTSTVVFVDTALSAAVFVALTKNRTDTTTYVSQQAAFTISLSSDTTFCQWLFKSDTTSPMFDTMSFYYQRHLQFLSNSCGFAFFYTLDSVKTTHYSNVLPPNQNFAIDSTFILNASVTNNANVTQLQVYIHTTY